MKKLNRITLNKIDQSNILKKNELKQIKGGYVMCTIFDSGFRPRPLYGGACGDPSVSICEQSCNHAYAFWGGHCECS